jgi:hypothetical protein
MLSISARDSWISGMGACGRISTDRIRSLVWPSAVAMLRKVGEPAGTELPAALSIKWQFFAQSNSQFFASLSRRLICLGDRRRRRAREESQVETHHDAPAYSNWISMRHIFNRPDPDRNTMN